MVRAPSYDRNGIKKGAWSKEEDHILKDYIHKFGHQNWRRLPFLAGLARCGKSCRLRWVNYLKPGLKRAKFAKHEEELIIKLHHQLGNKWSAIAEKLPGRTDNEIKNYWHAHIKKRGRRGEAGIRATLVPKEEGAPLISKINSSSSTTVDEINPKNANDLNPIADLYSFARSSQEDDLSVEYNLSHHQTYCTSQIIHNVDLPPFPAEEFHDFEIFQEFMQNDSFNSLEYCSSSSTAEDEFIGNFWSESFGEDILEILQI